MGWSKVTIADGSTEGFGPLCCSLWWVDMVRCGSARRVRASYGQAIVADGSTGGFGFLCCSLRE